MSLSDIVDLVEHRRRRYVGRIYRYPKERIVRRLLGTTWEPDKTRSGRQRTWMKMVQKDLKDNELDASVDRITWRNAIAEVLSKSGGDN